MRFKPSADKRSVLRAEGDRGEGRVARLTICKLCEKRKIPSGREREKYTATHNTHSERTNALKPKVRDGERERLRERERERRREREKERERPPFSRFYSSGSTNSKQGSKQVRL